MGTFVYSPKVQIHVQCTDKNNKGTQILDLSDDIISGQLDIRENALHTFQFRLQNTQRKYDSVLRPMDKIAVTMQRVGTPCRVFSGYLNNSPVFSAWPGEISLSATCTLKRLAYWYWDPGSPAAFELLSQWSTQHNLGTSNDSTSPLPATDSGIRDLVLDLLSKVVSWPKERIHVGQIPREWFSFAQAIADEINAAADESYLVGNLSGSVGGSTVGGLTSAGTLKAGTYGGVELNEEQATNASIIFNVAFTMDLKDKQASQGIGCAMQESSLINLDHGDRDSLGLFQQRPSQGWGTAAQVRDPEYAARKFFEALKGHLNEDWAPGIQSVQRSAFPSAYNKWRAMADACVVALKKSPGSGQTPTQGTSNASSLGAGSGSGFGSPQPGGSTGRNVAAWGYKLLISHKSNPIAYSQPGRNADTTPIEKVTALDCSSLISWCYYQAAHKHLAASVSSAQQGIMQHKMSGRLAAQIKGAPLWSAPGHIELSLGNGWTVAAHTDSAPLGTFGNKQVSISQDAGSFSQGGLLPGVDYTDAATTQEAADWLTKATGRPHTVSNPNEFPGDGSGTSDPGPGGGDGGEGDSAQSVFNALINIYTWGFQPTEEGFVLAGPRALMNDTSILPYIANLMNASMRSFCSGPNGDFCAWFPDYFDIWGTAGKMTIQAIELQDFTIDWSDDNIVTHQYVVGAPIGHASQMSDVVTGVGAGSGGLMWEVMSRGIATMDFPQIFRALFGEDATKEFLVEYLARFGARPNVQQVPTVQQGNPEFFLALFWFMRRWADQFTANIPITFMPELWPGMIVQIPEFGIQAYVTGVSHTFSYGPNGRFTTNITVCAPSRMGDKNKMGVFGLLPEGGGITPTKNSALRSANSTAGATP